MSYKSIFLANIRKISIFLLITSFLFLSRSMIRKVANDIINAPTASIFFSPSLDLTINSGINKIAFVHAEVDFDPTKIKLQKDPVPSGVFKNIIQQTPYADANTSGKLILVLGLAPEDIPNAPSGTFSFASLPFVPIVTSGTTTVTVDQSTLQIVDLSTQVVQTSIAPVIIDLTSLATPAPNTVSFNFTNYPSNIFLGDSFTSDLVMNTSGLDVTGTDLVIDYDPAKLALDSFDPSVFSQVKNGNIDNTTGKLTLTLFQDTSNSLINGSNLSILKLHFTSLSVGTANFSLNSQSVIAGPGTNGQNLLITAIPASVDIAALPTPSPTPTVYKDADINEDTHVDIADYLLLFQYYGQHNPSVAKADINKDSVVNIKDYAILYDSFGF